MIMKPFIRFYYISDQKFFFSRRKELKKFLLTIFKKEGYSVETINYIFCSDSFLLKINQQFLKHNTLTDIITFQLSDKGDPIISDIYISIDRIIYNSRSLGIPFKDELHRVIFHGALHLCGYNDKTMDKKAIIRQKEDFYLSRYLVPRETD